MHTVGLAHQTLPLASGLTAGMETFVAVWCQRLVFHLLGAGKQAAQAVGDNKPDGHTTKQGADGMGDAGDDTLASRQTITLAHLARATGISPFDVSLALQYLGSFQADPDTGLKYLLLDPHLCQLFQSAGPIQGVHV